MFPIGVADDAEFVVVKRLLGKGSLNMRKIADECNAKLRLRGIGSGFLETDNMEADMPLQLHVSCETYADYTQAIKKVGHLLNTVYIHHRRFCRSKSREPLLLSVNVQELRRDDLGLNRQVKMKCTDLSLAAYHSPELHSDCEKSALKKLKDEAHMGERSDDRNFHGRAWWSVKQKDGSVKNSHGGNFSKPVGAMLLYIEESSPQWNHGNFSASVEPQFWTIGGRMPVSTNEPKIQPKMV